MDIDILLATFKPNKIYLEKLLISLNNQDYILGKIKLIVCDDSDSKKEFNTIRQTLDRMITKFEYTIFKNEKNIGSNATFELLTKKSDAEFIAYCDQDDIWKEDKLTKLAEKIQTNKNTVLVYSDLEIIDSKDNICYSSFKDKNKRIKYKEGNNLFQFFLTRNCVTGCTMLIKRKIALSASPFNNEFYVHDHWLALIASTRGGISFVNQALVSYRIHGNNQVGGQFLKDVSTKNEYIEVVVKKEQQKYTSLLLWPTLNNKEINNVQEQLKNTGKRLALLKRRTLKRIVCVVPLLRYDFQKNLFEIILSIAPESFQNKIISFIKERG